MNHSKFVESLNQKFISLELMQKDMMERIKRFSPILSEREEKILWLRFELGGKGHQKSLKEIGGYLNFTKERIRQIERDALHKLQFSEKKAKQLKILLRKFHEKELAKDYIRGMSWKKLSQKYNYTISGLSSLFQRDFPEIIQQRSRGVKSYEKRKVNNAYGAPTIRLSGKLLESVGIRPESYVKVYSKNGKIIMQPISGEVKQQCPPKP